MARVSDVFLDRRLILGGAVIVWLFFAASLLMPYAHHANLAMWELFKITVREQLNISQFWRVVLERPRVILHCTFLFTNTLMVAAPVLLRIWPQLSGWMALALALGTGAAYARFLHMMAGDHLASGFYCWLTSVLLMAGVCFWNCGSYFRVEQSLTDTQQPDPMN